MRRILIVAVLTFFFSIPAWGSGSNRHKHDATRKPKIHFLFAACPGLRAQKDISLEFQNFIADLYGLPRGVTQEDFDQMFENGDLVYAPRKIGCFVIDPRLKRSLTMLAPAAIDYIATELVPAFCGNGTPKKIHHSPFLSSLGRTLVYQHALAKRDPNARAALGDDNPNHRSSHATGFSFDISGRNLTRNQFLQLGAFLLKEKRCGKLVEAIFEEKQNHFHVMVWPPLSMALW